MLALFILHCMAKSVQKVMGLARLTYGDDIVLLSDSLLLFVILRQTLSNVTHKDI